MGSKRKRCSESLKHKVIVEALTCCMTIVALVVKTMHYSNLSED